MDKLKRLDRHQVAVLIPALNESLRIREVVQGALAHCPNVIVVDDGSTDGTHDCIADLPITLLRHAQRQGKGKSVISSRTFECSKALWPFCICLCKENS